MKTTTNATKTTPGPWRVSERATEVETADGTLVCTLPDTAYTPKQEQERLATARLLAACPDLLAACKAAAEFLAQTVPDAGAESPLSIRLAGIGGAYVAKQIDDAIVHAEGSA